jgi:hypothetical protein
MWLKTFAPAVAALTIAIAGIAYAAQNTQQGRTAAYCLQKTGQGMQCKYVSMTECNKDKTGDTDLCIQNPNRATTGSGSQSPGSRPAPATQPPMIR